MGTYETTWHEQQRNWTAGNNSFWGWNPDYGNKWWITDVDQTVRIKGLVPPQDKQFRAPFGRSVRSPGRTRTAHPEAKRCQVLSSNDSPDRLSERRPDGGNGEDKETARGLYGPTEGPDKIGLVLSVFERVPLFYSWIDVWYLPINLKSLTLFCASLRNIERELEKRVMWEMKIIKEIKNREREVSSVIEPQHPSLLITH